MTRDSADYQNLKKYLEKRHGLRYNLNRVDETTYMIFFLQVITSWLKLPRRGNFLHSGERSHNV